MLQATTDSRASEQTDRRAHAGGTRLLGGGIDGNERLTAATGAALILLLAVIGLTLLRLRQLLTVHLYIGMLLLGPVLLKLASTGYRFVRYYAHNADYRRKGPPPAALRLIAPFVVLTTLLVFATGVALLLIGPSSRDTLLPIHKISFFVWVAFTALHVLAHLPSLPRSLRADYARRADHARRDALGLDLPGRAGRLISLGSALAAGALIGVLVIPDFAPWVHSAALHHHDH